MEEKAKPKDQINGAGGGKEEPRPSADFADETSVINSYYKIRFVSREKWK
jgi:hypothetical protein